MEMTAANLLSLAGTAAAIIFGWAAFWRTSRQDQRARGKHDGAILTEIGYIKAGVDDIKLEQRDQRAHNESFAARLTAAEGMIHETGRRLDRLESHGGSRRSDAVLQ